MKFTSPTKRKEYGRCPKRYYFRYLHKPATAAEMIEHRRSQNLYAVRELGGYLIHAALAKMVRSIAAGDRTWNYTTAAKDCLHDFTTIVAKSLAVEPGEWTGSLQLAETFNGMSPQDIQDEVNHWCTMIPTCIENGWRASASLQLKNESSDFIIEAEKPVVWTKGNSTYRYVFDVLIRSRYRVIVIDFKCHAVDNSDLDQIRFALDFLHRVEKVPESRLTGFAVDLRREEIMSVPYEPFRRLFLPPSISTTPSVQPLAGADYVTSYPATPLPDLCSRCPYATMCSESSLPRVEAKPAIGFCSSKLNLEPLGASAS